ncbi:MAG: FtsW/RodA/SpoVE family cell cycle protein [Spirochaetota bacterium]
MQLTQTEVKSPPAGRKLQNRPFYHLRLAWQELLEEFRLEQPYSAFLLLLGLEVLLIFTGAAFLYSNSNHYMLQRHFVWLGLGFALSAIIYLLPIRTLVQSIPVLACLALLLNILPQIPGLQWANDGSPRWIRLGGYSFQVSETLRLMLVLYFARRIAIRTSVQAAPTEGQQEEPYSKILWRPCIYLLLSCALVILQKDYSTTIMLLVTAAAMTVLVKSFSTLFIIIVLLVLMTIIAMLFLGQTFRINRVREWLESSGEQINWVYDAFREGSGYGVGLGQGRTKYLVPAEMTDFPLAAVGEEAGLLGIGLVLLLFLAFSIVGFHLARKSRVPFVCYATAGLTGLVFIQASVNFAVSCGLLPVTGQPLPFFSVGGSSTLIHMLILGLINSLNRPSRSEHIGVAWRGNVAAQSRMARVAPQQRVSKRTPESGSTQAGGGPRKRSASQNVYSKDFSHSGKQNHHSHGRTHNGSFQ